MLDVNPMVVRRFTDLPALTRANLLADGLVRSGTSLDGRDIARWIVELSEIYEHLRAEEIVELLNEARSAAGFPAIANQENVEEVLRGRRRHFRDAIKRCLDQLSAAVLVDVVTMAVDKATQNGTVHAPILIDDLVDTYEVEAQEFLDKETESLKTILERIRDAAGVRTDDSTTGRLVAKLKPGQLVKIDRLVAKLEHVVKNWDFVAQPIQVSLSSKGLSHALSHEVAGEIRALGIELYNKHSLLEVSQRLTAIQREVFAEIAKITEQLDDDASRLDELAEQRADFLERMKARAESWAREITYEADVGVMKNKLRISPQGVHWKGSTISLEDITWIRWSGTRHSVSGIPTGTTYSITVGAEGTFVQIELKKREVFTEFVGRLWKTAGVRLLTEMLEGLKACRPYRFGTAVVVDYGVMLERRRVFGANEKVPCCWTDLRIWNGAGTFCIAKKGEGKVAVELPYREVDNVHILEAAMRALWKRGSPRMSDLLEAT